MNHSQSPFIFACINFRNGALIKCMHFLKPAAGFLLGTAPPELKSSLHSRWGKCTLVALWPLVVWVLLISACRINEKRVTFFPGDVQHPRTIILCGSRIYAFIFLCVWGRGQLGWAAGWCWGNSHPRNPATFRAKPKAGLSLRAALTSSSTSRLWGLF